ncbi:chorismate mutase, partial [Actinomadura kijaniata]|uniref:chorismate mutase n=1 Tax=Actinomadura kijaniata TaxID=46161 RepID=UPI0031E446D9
WAGGPGDGDAGRAPAGRLGRRGAAGVVLDVPAADLARAWSVRRRAALPVVVDLRRPRVVPALAAAAARAAGAAGADGAVVTPDGNAGISGPDLPDLAVLTVLAPLLTSGPATGPGLAGLRRRLDLLDEQIVRLVAHRRAVARLVGAVKRRDRLPARDLRREVQVLDRAAALAGRLDADPRTVLAIFNLLIDDAVGAQRAVHTARLPEERPR